MNASRIKTFPCRLIVLLLGIFWTCSAAALSPVNPAPADSKKENIKFRVAFGALVGGEKGIRLEPVKDNTSLKSGDKFKLMVELQRKCFLYVIYHNSQGEMSLLFPYSPEQFENDYQLSKQYFLPPRDAWYELDDHAGTETFYLIASTQRLLDIEYLFNQYDTVGPSKKKDIAKQVLSEIGNILSEHREYTVIAEAPVGSATATRGVERSQGADPTDISVYASEIAATDFYSKTFVIDHH